MQFETRLCLSVIVIMTLMITLMIIIVKNNNKFCCMWILSSLAFYFAYIFVRLMSFSFNIFVS